ncbi:hypothetical protein P3T73_08190 [Kiritimatiellota bacterium B12222]|nr:hypothetical protein P3T73_08190 [Kiritimatiellota bacterium B12222]
MSKVSKPRTIYLVHHHLRRGGVTRVMLSAAEILRDAGEKVCLLSGEASAEKIPEGVALRVLPGLGYADGASSCSPEELKQTLKDLYREGDIWHLHNHSLGKNPMVTDVFCSLAEQGQSLVLQPHDFAEDGRPANLEKLRNEFPGFPDRLYPVGPHIQYAVLQQRDATVLREGGVPAEDIHLLPNPLLDFETFSAPQSPPQRCLYLTRAIRRKNVGEFLYWAACWGEEIEFATSLLPENPKELELFKPWQAFAEAEGIQVQWGVGMSGKSFHEVVAWSDACITTSVGEGFGMSFLEPYGMGRSVLGRNLPEITAGFSEDGVDLSGLYAELPVPVDAVDAEFWSRALGLILAWRKSMGAEAVVTISDLKRAWVREGMIDFGRLDEVAQRQVLREVNALGFCQNLDPFSPQPIAENRAVILNQYGPEPYLKRLQNLYGCLHDAAPVRYADGDRVRDAFLGLERVCLLRT